jgi:hypothetical protein
MSSRATSEPPLGRGDLLRIFSVAVIIEVWCAHFSFSRAAVDIVSSHANDSAYTARIIDAVKAKHRVDEGIRILDSLRASGLRSEEFLGNYARYVFHALIPEKKRRFSVLLKNTDQVQPTDTASPCSFRWKIISSTQAPLPFFEYQAGFSFRKEFRLVFSGLRKYHDDQAWLYYHDREGPSKIAAALIDQLSNRIDSAWCTIHIDLNDTKISPYEYLVKRISGIYDSIEVKSDLSQYRAISLRCYRRGLFVRPEGTYTAYIVFDRNVMDILKNDSTFHKTARKTDKNVRFTLTMRCGCGIQDQAEAKLQSIVRAF